MSQKHNIKTHKNKLKMIFDVKIPLAVSATMLNGSRRYTYRLTIPKMFFKGIENFDIIPMNNKYIIENNPKGQYKIMGPSKISSKITLPKNAMPELVFIENNLDKLKNIKKREPIYVYLKLKIDVQKNESELYLKFQNKYSYDKKVKKFKKGELVQVIPEQTPYSKYYLLIKQLMLKYALSPRLMCILDEVYNDIKNYALSNKYYWNHDLIIELIKKSNAFINEAPSNEIFNEVVSELEQMGEYIATQDEMENYCKKYKKLIIDV